MIYNGYVNGKSDTKNVVVSFFFKFIFSFLFFLNTKNINFDVASIFGTQHFNV